jgi:hypothetical protein
MEIKKEQVSNSLIDFAVIQIFAVALKAQSGRVDQRTRTLLRCASYGMFHKPKLPTPESLYRGDKISHTIARCESIDNHPRTCQGDFLC